MIYYSPIIMPQVMEEPFLSNWMDLIEGMTILLSKSISPDLLCHARVVLNQFCQDYELLYGLEHVNMNMHLLSHVVDCVEMNGPLWAYSCFGYESANGLVKRQV
eukprot:Pompholyxophrys_sp_v1_NODE_31_length_3649_cov_4.542571.p4 type:complete len:104 gc:universal NODE_31_length_3649_cov_4.542571:1072-761(-)